MTYFRRRLEAIEEYWGHFITHKICAFDNKESYRRLIYPEYKAGREEKPKELIECLQQGVTIATECDWTVASIKGWEADDILASVAKQGSDAGHKVVLVSQDKDLAQCLIDGKVTQLRELSMVFGEMKIEWFRAKDVPGKFGVEASQMIDYQCLVGDSGDNVKGVEGIGDKTARKLLNERKNLDELFKNPWVAGLGEKLRNRLIAFQGDQCDLARKLITLRTDLNLTGIVDFKGVANV